MTKLRAILLFIGLTLGVYADSWLVGGQPVNPFELWAGNDLSLDPETGELIVIHGIDLSGYPDARILLDHDATNDNEVVNYRTATNLIAQAGGSGAPAGDFVAQTSGVATNLTGRGITSFEGGFNGSLAMFYDDEGYTALDIDRIHLDRFYLNQFAEINVEFFKWGGGLLTDLDENTLINPLGRVLEGPWKVSSNASNDQDIVNYRTATNLIAQLSGPSNPFDQDLNTTDSPTFERVTFGSGNFEDGFESTATGFRINDLSNFDVVNIATHRLFDRFNDELALTWTMGSGGRNLLGRWSIIFDATNDQEIVNYRVLTNKIAQLAGGGGDNLGNHTATADLNLGNTNALTGVKEISFWDTANGLATASVLENRFKFAGSGFAFQASELKADDFLYAGSGHTQISLGDNETTIKGEDLLLLESRYQAILRSVSNGDTLIESGSPSDNERGEIFITAKHDGDAQAGKIIIKAEDPPSPGTVGQIILNGDVIVTNGSMAVGKQLLADTNAGLTLYDLNTNVARRVISGFTGVSTASDFTREVVFPLVDESHPAFTNSPVVFLSLATPVSEWVMVNLLSVSETNFTYEIMTSGGAVDDSWPVNWAAYARTP